MMIRAILFFVGRVQGVGFRYNAKEIARKFAVRGTVENCDDGRVKIVVEAESQEIDRFVEQIQVSMTGHIQKIDRFESEPSHEFENFSVRR
ncbi:MAG: acylphosphatase [Planctomycetota bacterium]|nr:acylphosphatase [Planctomycetota bacterium]